MAADRVPALAAVRRPVLEDISDGIAFLATRAEARNCAFSAIPSVSPGFNVRTTSRLIFRAILRLPPVASSDRIATTPAQALSNIGNGRKT